MSNAFTLFRALIVYGTCVPLAVFLGYLLATPEEMFNVVVVGIVLGSLTIPLFLRWHHPMLVLSWNMLAVMFFLPGHPMIFLPVCAISFTISLLQFILNKRLKFITVPAITWPLVALAIVVFVTGYLTGGGLRILGGSSYGGKRYVSVYMAVIGYFALTAKAIPAERAFLYVKMYFLSGIATAIGVLSNFVGPGLYFIFLLFPGDPTGFESASNNVAGDVSYEFTRVGWASIAGPAILLCMLGIYGIRGLFDFRRPWRLVVFGLAAAMGLLGGFRATLVTMMVTLAVQFYLEGLWRSRLLPVAVLAAILGMVVVLPFADKLPFAVQRSLSVLPIKVSPLAEMDARGSTEWRLLMWKTVLPEVPEHLLLGKGYSINAAELAMLNDTSMRNPTADPYEGAAVAGDFHNGPLSVIIPFGLWGTIAFLWLLYAGTKSLHQNYLYGDPKFKTINTLLLTVFVTKIIMFFLIFGSLYSDLVGFTGLLGLSVCINGGVHVPVPAPVAKRVFEKFRLSGGQPVLPEAQPVAKAHMP